MLRTKVTHFVVEDEKLFIKGWASEIRTYSEWVYHVASEDQEMANLYCKALTNVPEDIFVKITHLCADGKVSVDHETGLVVFMDFFGKLRSTSVEAPPLITTQKGVSAQTIMDAIDRGLVN